jgi:hypothetical protein
LVAALADRRSKPSSSTKVKPGGRMLQREIGHIAALRLYVSVTGGPAKKASFRRLIFERNFEVPRKPSRG